MRIFTKIMAEYKLKLTFTNPYSTNKTKVVCFCETIFEASSTNSLDPDQTAPVRTV